MPASSSRARGALTFSPILLALAGLCAPACAAVRLPAILSDHMVLQRAAAVPVWGWAAPGEQVTVQVGSQSASVRAGADGRWKLSFDLRKGERQPAVVVRGEQNEIAIADVLLGEVWLASGQSNMEKPLGAKQGQKPTFNFEQEIAAANYPDIRFFKVGRKKAQQPLDDVAGTWVRCSPDTLASTQFSAAAYFFGQRLHTALGTPVGLIDSTWGGTHIALWTPGAAPDDPSTIPHKDAAQLYNGMIAGLAPFALKGALWYQGETNITDDDDPSHYTARMETMITGWRRRWGSDFAFNYVQVAPHLYHVVRHARVIDPTAAPLLWEAQAAALKIPGTGMIVTTDLVDDLKDIHPREKKTVGVRLANVALAQSYGQAGIEAWGPAYRSLKIEGDKAIVGFDHAQGLAARDDKPLSWFDVAGPDGRWYPATATIAGSTVVLSSPKVAAPRAVRFAWDEAAQPNLVNGAGLPAVPFRSTQTQQR
jgi:sialate O-acetylesterase